MAPIYLTLNDYGSNSFRIIAGIIITTLLNAVVLWIVGKLGLGMVIEKFGTAFVAAFLVAIIGVLLSKLAAGFFQSAMQEMLMELFRLRYEPNSSDVFPRKN